MLFSRKKTHTTQHTQIITKQLRFCLLGQHHQRLWMTTGTSEAVLLLCTVCVLCVNSPWLDWIFGNIIGGQVGHRHFHSCSPSCHCHCHKGDLGGYCPTIHVRAYNQTLTQCCKSKKVPQFHEFFYGIKNWRKYFTLWFRVEMRQSVVNSNNLFLPLKKGTHF